jgi:hypothetical protein
MMSEAQNVPDKPDRPTVEIEILLNKFNWQSNRIESSNVELSLSHSDFVCSCINSIIIKKNSVDTWKNRLHVHVRMILKWTLKSE